MLGFFFPAVYFIRQNPQNLSDIILQIDSCNPLSDKLLGEYLDDVKIPYEFVELTDKSVKGPQREWKSYKAKIKRRLLRIEYALRGDNTSIFAYHLFRKRKNKIILPRWDHYLEFYSKFPLIFRINFDPLRQHLLSWAEAEYMAVKHLICIIERADPPPIVNLEQGKKARWFNGYGSTRRRLLGIEECQRMLLEKGYHSKVVNPGEMSLKEQIHTFSNCSHLIGIRGAEFLNMIWMKPGSTVILQSSADFKNEAIQKKLATACQLNYLELSHEGEVSPKLEFEKVKNLLPKLNHDHITKPTES